MSAVHKAPPDHSSLPYTVPNNTELYFSKLYSTTSFSTQSNSFEAALFTERLIEGGKRKTEVHFGAAES